MIYTDRNILISDQVNELHAFAKKIGLLKRWFKYLPVPNYQLIGSKVDRAIECGANLLDIYEMSEKCKQLQKNPILFDAQPASCRKALKKREDLKLKEYRERVIYFDPTDLYEKVGHKINPFSRNQNSVYFSIADCFPTINNKCGCGCGKDLTGLRTRWASDDCNKFAADVWFIISGNASVFSWYINKYYGNKCACCKENCYEMNVDHIVPVKFGGGGCWLSNFQLLCVKCHRLKTNEDFGWKQKK